MGAWDRRLETRSHELGRGAGRHSGSAPHVGPLGAAIVAIALASFLPLAAWAQPLPKDRVPQALQPWVSWVLEGLGDEVCPRANGAALCVWPGELTLDLEPAGGQFALQVRTDRAVAVALPGSAKHRPSPWKRMARPRWCSMMGLVPR